MVNQNPSIFNIDTFLNVCFHISKVDWQDSIKIIFDGNNLKSLLLNLQPGDAVDFIESMFDIMSHGIQEQFEKFASTIIELPEASIYVFLRNLIHHIEVPGSLNEHCISNSNDEIFSNAWNLIDQLVT